MPEKEAVDELWGAGELGCWGAGPLVVGAKLRALTCQIRYHAATRVRSTSRGWAGPAGPGIRTKKAPTDSHLFPFSSVDMKRFDNHAHNTFPNKYQLRSDILSFLRMGTSTKKLSPPSLGFSLLPRSDFTQPPNTSCKMPLSLFLRINQVSC
ncbi:hypothetical protein NA56DRAFT_712362 [Hyaloscypha hepaticicola]|uniref:Uncharacterized protein n=1 Tax=Hyaloscypha hepaticicola TaxID=2082293 RepID=A0A2J6PGQ9_9HELO|nr:hypothetical protein NA56DRAFT_712362 [Hyaloscypha hepaticicola]